jgi:TonB family protein
MSLSKLVARRLPAALIFWSAAAAAQLAVEPPVSLPTAHPIRCAKPEWPKEAVRKEQTGKTTLSFVVGADGRAGEVAILVSSGFPLLDGASQKTLSGCLFRADDQPAAPVRRQMQFAWALADSPVMTDPALIAAANAGSLPAQLNLAQHAHTAADAVHWTQMAALQGDAEAQFRFGLLLQRGTGIEKNVAEDMLWYRKAQAQGNLSAGTAIGILYEGGLGIDKDPAQALALYQHSANGGERVAMRQLARAYTRGDLGLAVDPAKATEWQQRSNAVR